ncbi:MAG: hypothetical protein ABSG59_09630 [Verrucomicrobiota bacterium]
MKSSRPTWNEKAPRCWASLLGLWMGTSAVLAADTNAPAASAEKPLTPQEIFEGGNVSYTNWIDLTTGGFIASGHNGQLEQEQQKSGNAFGGIEDMHYEQSLSNSTTVAVDGRALFNEGDYKLRLGIAKEKVGYLRLSYTQFRYWSDGDGGFYAASGAYYPVSKDAVGLDNGEFSIEGGLTLENKPQVTFKYTHRTRDGEEGSTEWGLTHPDGGSLVRGISPTVDVIKERSDSFDLNVTHHIKETDLGAGFHYETGRMDDGLNITQFPGEPVQQNITDREGTSYDLLGFHTFSETWIKTNLMMSSGFSYSDLDNNVFGSRTYGTDFGVGYTPNPLYGSGYYDLSGATHMHDYVGDLNLFYKPAPHLTIVPSVRVEEEDWNAESRGTETLANFAPTAFTQNSERAYTDVRQRLDATYNGFTNWVLYARADLTEEDGNLNQYGGLVPIAGIGLAAVTNVVDDRQFLQKYSVGARWYPSRRVTVDVGGYYKSDGYHYDNVVNSAPGNYPAYLIMQDSETYDGNFRLTLRPWQKVTMVSRYEFQWSTIGTTPDPISGLAGVESSKMASQIIGQDASWSPWSRLSLQAGLNYVLSETKTPASDATQAILNAQNNYWTLNFSSMLIVDNKTDLNLSYFYYLADNYVNNSVAGLPLGVGEEEHSITAALTRRISKNMRLSLRYGFFLYDEVSYGGNRNNSAQFVQASMRYRF